MFNSYRLFETKTKPINNSKDKNAKSKVRGW